MYYFVDFAFYTYYFIFECIIILLALHFFVILLNKIHIIHDSEIRIIMF